MEIFSTIENDEEITKKMPIFSFIDYRVCGQNDTSDFTDQEYNSIEAKQEGLEFHTIGDVS